MKNQAIKHLKTNTQNMLIAKEDRTDPETGRQLKAGKKNVGYTSKKNPNDRWKNGKHYERNAELQADIETFGFDAFEHGRHFFPVVFIHFLHKSRISEMEKNRKTMRFRMDGKTYFIKLHGPVGWGEIWKNLLQFKLPVIGSANEYLAISLLSKLGVPTMTACAFGIRGSNPAAMESFLVTETGRRIRRPPSSKTGSSARSP